MPEGASIGAARDHWRDVLPRGMTYLPRWREGPTRATVESVTHLSDDLVAALENLAAALSVGVGAVLLGVHAKVIGLLSGERLVHIGYRSGAQVLPCLLDLRQGSWRRLIEHAGRVEATTVRYGGYPLAELRDELGLPSPPFEAIVDPGQDPLPPSSETVLRVGLRRGTLRMWRRCDVVDEDYAARIAGYHLAAFRAACADPDADHQRSCLLSEAELRFQDAELAGRPRRLPDHGFARLFEDRVRRQPDTVAAVLGDARLGYGELNRRANQMAHALLARGLGAEDVVAVCMERHLDWLTAVIATFKAGCVYLPIEPHFPRARIAGMLSRSGCRLALTDQSGQHAVAPAIEAMTLEELRDPRLPSSDPGRTVGLGQAAYIYFTSGSTGTPKGAMCEHGGMLNHLLAKVDDLEIGSGTRVAQTAPQCFDISLWQLLAPLLVGGTTVLIPQDAVLDLERFTGELARQRVEVLQVVPSYLDVLLAELSLGDRPLPALRVVSVTGEALKLDLARRWFDRCPGTRLVNAYGATEASDDTTHEVMDRAPDGPRVPLGRPVAGALVHVVDENLFPVPLGAPGEIVFSGICVGRGYVNDEERTRLAFTHDPRSPDRPMYRSGDFGRWAPDGKLEFLGRRDNQVKIRGFRIEIEEIEERLLGIPGVREAAVVVAGGPAETRLVACYSAPPSLPADSVPAELAATLPDYMVPSHFWWLDTLPLSDNGKVDRKALAEITARSSQGGAATTASRTPTEERLATAWARVLGTTANDVSPSHHFFDEGGTSLSALRLALQLDMEISLADITRHPTFTDLARRLERPKTAPDGLLHRLSAAGERVEAMLLCLPYAGGNAVNYLPLADALRGTGVAVFAVEPSGEVARDEEAVIEVAALAEAVAAEVARLPAAPILLWGHSSGSAAALETTRLLCERGRDVRRLFIGAQLLGQSSDRSRSIEETNELADDQIMADLSAQTGHTELGELDERHTARLAAAYRRDSLAADHYFLHLLEYPPAPLEVPVSVVLAADDLSTPDHRSACRAWRLITRRLDVRELADGGHYFVVSRPARVAAIVTESWREHTDTGPGHGSLRLGYSA
jgi:amino acid adenylation domain-containing protein